VPFLLAGMPAIDVIDFEFGSAPGLNDYWHTPEDSMDKLSVESLQTVGDTVLRMIENLQ
jgi:Zn-dependent M28 family amino/carboxypeptidase